MIKLDILTIFPNIFDSYLKESIIKRALKKGLIKIKIHDLRRYTSDRHHTVDDKPYGGGIGMVMKIEPIYRAVAALKRTKSKKQKTRVILFSPRGKKFNQKLAHQLSKLNQIILICGRYEGIDERAAKCIADDVISIGDYVLMGGELPAMVLTETVARLISGVIGKDQFLKERIPPAPGRGGRGFIELPQYTRPEVFFPRLRQGFRLRQGYGGQVGGQAKKNRSWRVPKVLLSGDHKKIEAWRKKHGRVIDGYS